MNLVRALLFDNIGLKLVALLMAVLVYLNVFTDRPAVMMVSFPLAFEDLPDSLTLAGAVPAAVQAELRGTGKQLIRLRLTEPRVEISLAGAAPGHYERALGAEDLPLAAQEGIKVERLIGPRMVELNIERKLSRRVPVRIEIAGQPADGYAARGAASAEPPTVEVRGPHSAVAALDTVVLAAVRVDHRRDTLETEVAAARLPEWTRMEPAQVRVTVPIGRR